MVAEVSLALSLCHGASWMKEEGGAVEELGGGNTALVPESYPLRVWRRRPVGLLEQKPTELHPVLGPRQTSWVGGEQGLRGSYCVFLPFSQSEGG
jgi:hypothetical protein